MAQVIINEYSAANMDGLSDNYGEHEDWVELYNPGAAVVDLSGYFLSDNSNNPGKWEFPAGIAIGPGEHLIIYCSDRDEVSGSFIHAGFKLTQTKLEYVVLSDPQQNTVDIVLIANPNQVNHSIGRVTDGDAQWGVFLNPTPAAPNFNAYQYYAEKPFFSLAPGFYNGPVSASIEMAPGTEVRYTTNGAEPTATSPLYTGPVDVTQTTVIKARAYSIDPSVPPSFTEANTYFIDENHTIPVLSIAGTDLQNLLNGNQFEPRGSFEYFDNGELIDEAYGEYNKHGNDSWAYGQRGIDYITRDQMGYTSSISHQVFENKSRDNFQRLILKAAANDNYPFEEGAHIRDAYVQVLSQNADMELDERSYTPCVIYLNGQYWGIYEIREKVDDPDFTRYYYDQGEKWIDYIKTWGNTWEEYGSRDDWDVLHNFITTNDMATTANYEAVKEQLNVLSLIDYMIINTHVVTKDWLNWNTSWWRGRKPEGEARKWRYAMWDLDATFGHYINYTGIPDITPYADPCYAEDLPADFEGHGALIQALMANEEFHSLYVNRYADMNNSFFTCDYMLGLLDSLIGRIEPEMPRQIEKWGGSMAQWQANVQELIDFINTRCTVIDGGIENCYDVTGPYPVTILVKPANEPNEVKVNTFVPAAFPWQGDYFAGTTLNFYALPQPGWELDHWEAANNAIAPDPFSPGIHLSLADTIGDTITAVFRPAVPCANAFNFNFDTTFSTINALWEGVSNTISFEFGHRKTGSGDDWTTVSVSDPNYTIYGLDICSEYDIRVRAICDFAIANYEEFVIKTACLTGTKEPLAGVLEWNVFPNPFQTDATVDFILAKSSDVAIRITTYTGQTVYAEHAGLLPEGQHRIKIEARAGWAAGLYVVQLITDSGTVSRRIIKK
jgi:CotH protein/lamin tail-like protein/chitobiase/beta-hexosaminidase-like protein